MKPEINISQIPIYRCTPEIFKLENDKLRKEYNPTKTCRIFENYIWFPQRYNDVIGWLRIYSNGDQIRAEEWWSKSKKISRKPNQKPFYLNGDVFCCSFIPFEKHTNDEIFKEILNELEDLKKLKKYKNRFIDLEEFNEIGPYINWSKIINGT